MKKHSCNTLINLDQFPTVKELQRMSIEELEALVAVGKKELEHMQNLVDHFEQELKNKMK